MTVLAAYAWKSNAELIADVAKLGYLDGHVLDPTYGRGTWWKVWQPEELTTHDIRIDGVDFRALPEADESFDAVAFDPPYVAMGGRSTTKLPDFFDRFGLTDAARTPADLQVDIEKGLVEMNRVAKRRGIVLVKCQDYVNSGHLWIGTHHTLTAGIALGLELVDRFERTQLNPRPQPSPNRRQVHARRNLSTLLVFRKPA